MNISSEYITQTLEQPYECETSVMKNKTRLITGLMNVNRQWGNIYYQKLIDQRTQIDMITYIKLQRLE